MRASSIYLIALNLVAILIFTYVQQDIAYRMSYWYSPAMCQPYIGGSCFTPTLSRGFLYYVLSATCTNASGCGDAHIPGTTTFDWSQTVLLVAAIADGITALQYVRRRANGAPNSNQMTTVGSSSNSVQMTKR